MFLIIVTLILVILINENVEARALPTADTKLKNEMMDLEKTKNKFDELTKLSISYVKDKTIKSKNKKGTEKKGKTWFDKCDERCKTSRRLRLLLNKKKEDTSLDQLFDDVFT